MTNLDLDETLPTHVSCPPPLEELTFEDCTCIDMSTLEQVLECLKRGPYWPEFKGLSIKNCSEIFSADIKRLVAIIPKNTISLRSGGSEVFYSMGE